jgi:transposase
MQYIGCDFHPSFQVIAQLDKETGELVRRRLGHSEGQGEVHRFYQALPGSWVVGVEATGTDRAHP